jgi:hypothetical protein
VFGPEDNVGLLNLLTPERVVRAAHLIRKGAVFSLNAPVNAFSGPLAARRSIPRHHVLHAPGSLAFDDVLDNFYLQGSSQWDALGHVGYTPDAFYNGATEQDVASGRRNTIEHWARRGIVGRAVLLDMPSSFAEAERPYDPSAAVAFTVEDLELARRRQDVELQRGDILILHTGFVGWYLSQDAQTLTEFGKSLTCPGVDHSEDICRYLWDTHIAAVASDTYSVEVFPFDRHLPMGFLHRFLIGQFGMPLGELWWTEDLASDCRSDGVYEMFLTSAPLHTPGAVGSPPNALAIK